MRSLFHSLLTLATLFLLFIASTHASLATNRVAERQEKVAEGATPASPATGMHTRRAHSAHRTTEIINKKVRALAAAAKSAGAQNHWAVRRTNILPYDTKSHPAPHKTMPKNLAEILATSTFAHKRAP